MKVEKLQSLDDAVMVQFEDEESKFLRLGFGELPTQWFKAVFEPPYGLALVVDWKTSQELEEAYQEAQ